MGMSSRLQELRKKHETLAVQVEEAERSLSADSLAVTDLKKQKLRLKEEIARLTQA